MAGTTFPLRLRNARIRALVREIAQREGISQNQLLEQAAENEVLVRGELLTDDLAASVERLRSLTTAAAAAVARSIDEFAAGEASRDPIRARQFTGADRTRAPRLGAVRAFRRGA